MTHLSALHGQNVESWTIELAIYTGLKRVNFHYRPVRKYLPVVKKSSDDGKSRVVVHFLSFVKLLREERVLESTVDV